MTDRRRRAAASDSTSREDNPFAPPPEGQPDRPWEPRVPRERDTGESPGARGTGGTGSGPSGSSGQGPGTGGGSADGSSTGGSSTDDSTEGGPQGGDRAGAGGSDGEQQSSGWGSQWSARQPGRQSGGFGGGPGKAGSGSGNGRTNGDQGPSGPGGSGGPDGPGGTRGMRWDPTDPLQRHARYSLHAGIWGLFFALLSVPQVALLLGALSLYWGSNALRGKLPASATKSGGRSAAKTAKAGKAGKAGKKDKGGRAGRKGAAATAEDVAGTARGAERNGTAEDADGKPRVPLAVTPAQADKAKRTAAISGLVTASLTLVIVGATFAFQFVYSDFYACQNDALTQSSRDDCTRHLPEELRPFLEDR
ncbi:hypothetical protein [Streptomyces qinglanensis]|uniref:hypothetical protein n=1 Tax=Streptomyces qinglanensis TaxID=943816 RepID=UPI003D75F991